VKTAVTDEGVENALMVWTWASEPELTMRIYPVGRGPHQCGEALVINEEIPRAEWEHFASEFRRMADRIDRACKEIDPVTKKMRKPE
jgi:hypothetical protein